MSCRPSWADLFHSGVFHWLVAVWASPLAGMGLIMKASGSRTLRVISESLRAEYTVCGSPPLEQYLKEVKPYASSVSISWIHSGWMAWADIVTPAIGATLKVKSEILSSPYDAAKQLHERVMSCLS